jgi:hypothetical protein
LEEQKSSEEGRSRVQCLVCVAKTTSPVPHLRQLVQPLETAQFSIHSVPTRNRFGTIFLNTFGSENLGDQIPDTCQLSYSPMSTCRVTLHFPATLRDCSNVITLPVPC